MPSARTCFLRWAGDTGELQLATRRVEDDQTDRRHQMSASSSSRRTTQATSRARRKQANNSDKPQVSSPLSWISSSSSSKRSNFDARTFRLTVLMLASFAACEVHSSTSASSVKEIGRYITQPYHSGGHHNRDGSVTNLGSQPAITTTTPPPVPVEVPDFVEPIGNHTVAVGRDAQLSCKISKLGSFRTAWLRVEDKGILTIHNNVITRNYRVGLKNDDDEGKNFILTIKNVQPSDRGGYMCQINSVPMRYAIGYLDVLTPPVFDQENNNNNSTNESNSAGIVVVGEGSNASLSCQANGHPAPEITWRREDNEPIRLSGQEEVPKVEGLALTLAQVSRLNSGAYLCIASNGVQPSASKRQVLDVQYKPVIRLPQTEVEARLGQTEAQLSCFVDLNPLGTYHWAKLDSTSEPGGGGGGGRGASGQEDDDQALIEHYELINSDKHEIVVRQANSETVQMVLVVRRIEKSDLTRYKCIARNSLGIQSNSIRLAEPTSFSLNNMFGGGGSGRAGASTQDSTLPNSPDQQLNDQQDTGGSVNRGTAPASRGQYLSTRANSRSSWIQRSSSSPSKASSGEPSSARSLFSASSRPLVALSIIVASIAQIVVVIVYQRTLVQRRLPIGMTTANGRR